MDQGNVFARSCALIAALACLQASLCSQGLVYRERWGYLHLENRRLELLREVLPREALVQQRVAELLVEPDLGVPFAPVAKALAHVRGVAADANFVLRSAVCVFVLPEVADPDGRNEACRVTSISVHLPFTLPLPKELAFDIEVCDAAGKRLWSERLAGEMPIEDLCMARPVARVPCGELADGTYQLRVRTLVSGAAPAATDPVLQWPLHVLRGYQARCQAALASVREVAPGLAELPRALLEGCSAPVLRACFGEAFEGTSTAVLDINRLELALRNVAAEKHVMAGMTGDVATALPTGERALAGVLRLPAGFAPDGERPARPLVVFAAATPCFDMVARRPTSPGTRGPSWVAQEMPTFGARACCDVAFVDSPGEGRNYAPHLGRAIRALRQVFGTGDRPVVLVCDREAAGVVALHFDALRPHVAGLVLLGAGGMTGRMLDELGSLPVRLVMLHGHPGGEGLQRSLDYVLVRRRAAEWSGDVQSLVTDRPAWLFGVPLLAGPIEAFAAEVFAR